MAASSSEMTHSQPNLTPLLDMVFQLITFFMLVINFKEASLDQSLQLPVLGSARPVETKGEEDLLVVTARIASGLDIQETVLTAIQAAPQIILGHGVSVIPPGSGGPGFECVGR